MHDAITLLVVECCEETIEKILIEVSKLELSYVYKVVSSFEEVKAELQDKRWSCIICTDEASDFSAVEVYKHTQGISLDIPFIIIANADKEEQAIAAMRLGVKDYVTSNDMKRLAPAIFRELQDASVRRERTSYFNELMQEKERLDITLSSIGDGVITTDTNGNVLLINSKASSITGWSLEDASGRLLQEVFNIYDLQKNPEAKNLIERVLNEKGAVGLRKHTKLKNKYGAELYVSASSAPIRNSQQDCTGIVIVFRDITMLKTIEDKIAAEQRNFKAVFYEAPIGMLIIDEDSNISNANVAFMYMMQDENPDYIGKRIGDVFKCSMLDSVRGCGYGPHCKNCRMRGVLEYVLKNEKPAYGLEVLCTKYQGGEEKSNWYRMSSQPLIIDGKKSVMLTIDDITLQKQLSLDLLRSEENLRQITDNILEMIIRCDLKGNIDFVSASAKSLLDYLPSEIVGKSIYDFLHPEDADRIKGIFKRHLANNSKGSAEFRCFKRDGDYIWMDVSGNLLTDEEGKTSAALLVGRDITQQRQMQNAIIESERRYKVLFEGSSDIIFTNDINGNIQSVNKAGEATMGFTIEELKSMNINDLIIPETLETSFSSEQYIKTVLNEREPIELNIFSKKGERLILEVSRQLIYEDGRPVGVQGIARDITHRKRIEAELQRAKDEAEAANMAKSEFLANMSHEIRTPMNGMTGMLDLLNLTRLDKEQQEYLDIVKSCVDSLLKVLNDILDFSKIEAGKLVIETISFDLREVADKLVKAYEVKASEKGLKLDCYIDPAIPEGVVGDPLRLRQVLGNLMGNAVKFTDYGEVSIRVEKYGEVNDQLQIKFSVRDTGIGIAEEEMNKLFKSFSQVDGSFTRKYSGTGLGLAISKRLVEMMGGAIWVESEKDIGSTFHFIVFLGSGGSTKKEPIVKPEIKQRCESVQDILLVEDNRMNQLTALTILEKKGYRVDLAVNGREALEKLKNSKYDIILMDIQMPEMDGIEATKKIREEERQTGKHIPIIALTAYALQGDSERFLSKGMDFYVPKPIKIDELLQAIEQAAKLIEKGKISIEYGNKPTDFSIQEHEKYIKQISEIINTLESAIERENYLHIEQCAHRMKEAAKHLYLNKLRSTAFKMEMAARKQKLEEIEEVYRLIKNEITGINEK